MCGGQQLAEGLAAQDIAPARRIDAVGRVGLAALELRQRDRAGKARRMLGHPAFDRARIDRVVGGDRDGPDHRLHVARASRARSCEARSPTASNRPCRNSSNAWLMSSSAHAVGDHRVEIELRRACRDRTRRGISIGKRFDPSSAPWSFLPASRSASPTARPSRRAASCRGSSRCRRGAAP